MTALEASSVRVRTMADGTLRAELDFEPRHAAAAFTLLGAPGQPVAVAALRIGAPAEQAAPINEPPPLKGGPLSQWLAIRCGEPEFQQWLASHESALWAALAAVVPDARGCAAELVRLRCEVRSRAEIDNDPAAAARFQERIRGPWAKHYQGARA